MSNKNFWLYNLFRHQIAGFIATLVDFGIFNILLFSISYKNYLVFHIISSGIGAVINFFISSYWAFSGSKNSLKNQMNKYVIVSTGSLVLNTLLVYLLTDFGQLHPNYSKIIAAIFIASTYNFLFMRYYVFKK